MVHLDHQRHWIGLYMHPKDAMPDYGSDIANYNSSSALALMLEGDEAEKRDAVIAYVNNGIDLYYMMIGGKSSECTKMFVIVILEINNLGSVYFLIYQCKVIT